ncbi:hypothetical protein [Burkholderia cenocepacia]|uniref:hypothetical protein n=1 Tax=Burkholderia cenocepacia TaxID=95486 RepID=UPI002AB77869|nr:hypothetical protein [Burkholderia cenocepacia]
MKKNIVLGLLLIISMIGVVSAAELNRADVWDIKSAARWAAVDQAVTVGEPVAHGGNYQVDVKVNNRVCRVMVRPYNPSENGPPIRWKAEKAQCT